MRKLVRLRSFTPVFAVAVLLFTSGFDLKVPKLPSKLGTVRFSLRDVSASYEPFAGTALDPFAKKQGETLKTGKKDYDEFFSDSRKLLMSHAFAKHVVAEANKQKAAGQIPLEAAAAAATIGLSYGELQGKATGLLGKAQNFATAAKKDFTGVEAVNGIKIGSEALDISKELKTAVAEYPDILKELTALASVKK